MQVIRRRITHAGAEVHAVGPVVLEAAEQMPSRIRIPFARHARRGIAARERLRLIEQRFAMHFADDAEARPARECAADAPFESRREVVAVRAAAQLDPRRHREIDLLGELARRDQIKLKIRFARPQAVVLARARDLRHHARPDGIAVVGRLRAQVELCAQPQIAEPRAPSLVDQVILRLAIARHRHEIRVDAAIRHGAEQLDPIRRPEREHAADVGDVAESFAAILVDELEPAAPSTLRQRLALRYEPDPGVSVDRVTAGPAVLGVRGKRKHKAQH